MYKFSRSALFSNHIGSSLLAGALLIILLFSATLPAYTQNGNNKLTLDFPKVQPASEKPNIQLTSPKDQNCEVNVYSINLADAFKLTGDLDEIALFFAEKEALKNNGTVSEYMLKSSLSKNTDTDNNVDKTKNTKEDKNSQIIKDKDKDNKKDNKDNKKDSELTKDNKNLNTRRNSITSLAGKLSTHTVYPGEEFSLDTNKPGGYVITASSGKLHCAKVLILSDYMTVSSSGPRSQSALWLVNAKTGLPFVPDRTFFSLCKCQVNDIHSKEKTIVAGLDVSKWGLVNLPKVSTDSHGVFLACQGDNYVLAEYPGGNEISLPYRTYMELDKPAYNRDDTVNWHAAVRSRGTGGYTIPKEKSFTVSLYSPLDQNIASADVQVLKDGLMNGTFTIPEHAETGLWQINIKNAQGILVFSKLFSVTDMEKDEEYHNVLHRPLEQFQKKSPDLAQHLAAVAAKESKNNPQDTFAVLLDKEGVYKAGEIVKASLKVPYPNIPVLITLEREEVESRMVVKLKGDKLNWNVAIGDNMFPAFKIRATYVKDNKICTTSKTVFVSSLHKIIKTQVETLGSLSCGKNASLKIKTTTPEDKPIQANLSLSISGPFFHPENEKSSLVSRFYGPNNNFTVQTWGLNAPEPINLRPDKPQNPGESNLSYKNILWEPNLATNSSGTTEVAITWPDTPGVWKVTALSSQGDGCFGESITYLETQKNNQVRLLGPEVIHSGDIIEYTLQLKNFSYKNQEGTVEIASGNSYLAKILDSSHIKQKSPKKVSIPPSECIKIPVAVKADVPGKVNILITSTLSGTKEKIAVPVTVTPVTSPYTVYKNTEVKESGNLVFPKFEDSSNYIFAKNLQLELTAGLSGILYSSLNQIEKNSSSNQPVIASSLKCAAFTDAIRSLNCHNLPKPAGEDEIPDLIASGLKDLSKMQNKDGGFGYWPGLPSDCRSTAWVILCLHSIVRTDVRDQIADKASLWLSKNLPKQSIEDKVFSLLALSLEKRMPQGQLDKIAFSPEKLAAPSYFQLLILLNNEGRTSLAKTLLAKAPRPHTLAQKMESYWEGTDKWNDIQTTAFAIKAHLLLKDPNPLISSSVNWLISKRRINNWNTAEDTLCSISSISHYLRENGESASSFRYGVWLNGNEVESKDATPEKWNKIRALSFSGDQMPKNPITIQVIRSGNARLWLFSSETLVLDKPLTIKDKEAYLSSDNSSKKAPKVSTSGKDKAKNIKKPSVKVIEQKHKYWKIAENGKKIPLSDSNPQVKLGDILETELTLTAKEQVENVKVTDSLASGFDYSNMQSSKDNINTKDLAVTWHTPLLKKGPNVFRWTGKASFQGAYKMGPLTLESPFSIMETTAESAVIKVLPKDNKAK